MAASLAVLVLGNWGINEWRLGRAWPHASATQSAMLRLDDELFNAHQRALLLNQLIAVPSSDQHTVKPWFAGRVDYSPPVPDLVADGFILQGGRLDYIDHRKVAVLIYQRRLHMIDVFVWPSAENDNAAASQPNTPSGSPARIDELALSDIHTQQGYQRLCWRFAAMHYCAVSDLNGGELEQFARLLTQRISTSAAAPA